MNDLYDLWDKKRLNEKIDRMNNSTQKIPFDGVDIAKLKLLIKVERFDLNNLLCKLNSEPKVEDEVETELEKEILKKQNLVYRYMLALSYIQKH